MKIIIAGNVLDEIKHDYLYYQEQTTSGNAYLSDYYTTLDRIEQNPEHYRKIDDKNYRRCNFQTFPHCIFFKIMVDHIYIIALAHQKRKPRYF